MSANQRDVEAAFELLIEQVDREIELVNARVNDALQARDYGKAHQATDEAESLKSLRDKLEELRRKWHTLRSGQRRRPQKAARRSLGKARRGARTPEEAYYVPILSALVELGGGGKVHEVLQRVEAKMKPILKPIDYQSLPSSSGTARWSNAAQWARMNLMRRGLMKNTGRRGFWEISSEGRVWLAKEAQNERGQDRGNSDGSSENS